MARIYKEWQALMRMKSSGTRRMEDVSKLSRSPVTMKLTSVLPN